MKNESTLKNVESIVNFETLETLARTNIQGFMQSILEEEVDYFLGRLKYERCSQGKIDQASGHRNGYGRPRKFGMMSGTVIVRRPRIRGLEERFESKVLPLFKRRSKSIDNLLPDLYLHGLSSGDFEMAMRGLLGDGAPLSASSIIKLKGKWTMEYDHWKKSDLSGIELVYCWADGLYVKAGLEDRKAALLVIIGADRDGNKYLIACESGERESKESWLKILRDLKARGLKLPKVTVADGALGLWSALGELHPEGEEQRCWNHKITNVLDDLNKKDQPAATELLKRMPFADTKKECEQLRDEFADKYKKVAPKAVATLARDWDRMVTFYSFPREHWKHLRTSNIVESPFSAIRLRTDAARRFKKVEGAKAMIWKLLTVAEKNWNKLSRPDLMKSVFEGKKFEDGLPLVDKRIIETRATA